jgi:hypothetical protein
MVLRQRVGLFVFPGGTVCSHHMSVTEVDSNK